MPSATLSALERPRRNDAAKVRYGPVVVATDGSLASDAALRFAAHLEERADASVILLSVIEPVVVMPMDLGIALPLPEIERTQRELRMTSLTTQLDRLGLRNAGWQLKIEYGDPATRIANVARESHATVVIAGLGKHDLSDRILGSETAIRTLRTSSVPVLAVSEFSDALPRLAVIATDFSLASLDAARAALRLFPDLSEIHFVHVTTRLELPPEVMVTWDGLYTEPVGDSFQRLTTMLDVPESIKVRTVTREGKVSREVLQYARSVGADLIVTGSRGAGFFSRLLVGSTATGIVRSADRPVLAVPASPGSERLIGVEEFSDTPDAESTWSELLSTFTKRNIGRRTSLEVDDPAYGVQVQERGYPLLGVAYDHHDHRVAIMLGDVEGTERHLTRGIADVKSVDVLREASGRDHALRIAHGRGQTLLTFES